MLFLLVYSVVIVFCRHPCRTSVIEICAMMCIGSTHNRTVGEENRGKRELVHKDIDFADMHRTIGLPHHLAESLRGQITQDANFLAGHGIIDYSLLIGVHNGTGSRRSSLYSDGLSSAAPSASRPPATPRTPVAKIRDNEMTASVSCAAAAAAAGDAASSQEQRVRGLAELESGLRGLGQQSSPEQRQRQEQKDRWVARHIHELQRKYHLLTGHAEENDSGAAVRKQEAQLRREGSSPEEIQRKQLELMEQLEHDPDNEALLEQVKALHRELVITVSGPGPGPEPEHQDIAQKAAVCDALSWANFVELAFAHSSSGAAATGATGDSFGTEQVGGTRYYEVGAARVCFERGSVATAATSGETTTPASIFAQHKGGMRAVTYRPEIEPTSFGRRVGSDVVFVGIIDTLVPFKLRKKVRSQKHLLMYRAETHLNAAALRVCVSG